MKPALVIGLLVTGLVIPTSCGEQAPQPVLYENELLLPEKDVRVGSGKEVDLAPVHQWLAKPAGEPPLKHWKRLQILEVKGKVAGHTRCVVKTEENVKTELLMANLPAEPAAFLQSVKQQHGAILRKR